MTTGKEQEFAELLTGMIQENAEDKAEIIMNTWAVVHEAQREALEAKQARQLAVVRVQLMLDEAWEGPRPGVAD